MARVGRCLDARAGRRGSTARRNRNAGKRVRNGSIRNIDARRLVDAVFRAGARRLGTARERASGLGVDAAGSTASGRDRPPAPPLPAFACRGTGRILAATALHVAAVAVGGRADAGQTTVGGLHAARSVTAGGARRAAHPFTLFACGAAGGVLRATAAEITAVATGGNTRAAAALGERIGTAASACGDGEGCGGQQREPQSGAHRRGPRLSNTCACASREQSRGDRDPVRAKLGQRRAGVSANAPTDLASSGGNAGRESRPGDCCPALPCMQGRRRSLEDLHHERMTSPSAYAPPR